MKSKVKKKIALLLWIVLNVAVVFGISSMFLQIERKTQEYIKEKNEFFLLQRKINSFNARKTVFENQQKEISIINNAFLKKETEEGIKLASLISEFENVASSHKVSIETQAITQPTDTTPFYVFNFKFSGKFPNVLKLFFAIENTPLKEYKLMGIQKVNIKRTASSSCTQGQEESCVIGKTGVEGEFDLMIYIGVPKKEDSSQQQSSSSSPATTVSPTQSP